MTDQVHTVDLVEVVKVNCLLLHVSGKVCGPVIIDADPDTDDSRLLSMQALVRNYIRRGVPILDQGGLCSKPTSKNFKLLNAHDEEFLFHDLSQARELVALRKRAPAWLSPSLSAPDA